MYLELKYPNMAIVKLSTGSRTQYIGDGGSVVNLSRSMMSTNAQMTVTSGTTPTPFYTYSGSGTVASPWKFYTVWKFTSSAVISFDRPTYIECCIVAGGGASGVGSTGNLIPRSTTNTDGAAISFTGYGGGGGAGGLIQDLILPIRANEPCTITVGGAGSNSAVIPSWTSSGYNEAIPYAIAGGAGGDGGPSATAASAKGKNGGSGGGGGAKTGTAGGRIFATGLTYYTYQGVSAPGGAGTNGQGYNGGRGTVLGNQNFGGTASGTALTNSVHAGTGGDPTTTIDVNSGVYLNASWETRTLNQTSAVTSEMYGGGSTSNGTNGGNASLTPSTINWGAGGEPSASTSKLGNAGVVLLRVLGVMGTSVSGNTDTATTTATVSGTTIALSAFSYASSSYSDGVLIVSESRLGGVATNTGNIKYGTKIVTQLTGTAGGAGNYQLSVDNTGFAGKIIVLKESIL